MDRQRRTAVVVGLVGIAIVSLVTVRILASSDWNATIFISVGEDDAPIRAYAEERLSNVFLRSDLGHDGRFFFVQANDPLLLQPDQQAAVFDRPLYRTQRMFFPLIAGGFGTFSPPLIVWAMLVTNLVALGVGTWLVAVLAEEKGGSPWWGLAFALNLGFVSEVNIGGAGVVAAAAAFGAVVAFVRGKDRWGVLLLVMAALSREAMLIVAAGTAWWLWRNQRRRSAVGAALVPAAAVGLWALYVRLRLGWDQGALQVKEIGLPFRGIYEAFPSWINDPVNLVVGVTLLFLLVLYTKRALESGRIADWAFLGFVPLGLVLTEQVWRNYFDISRALAPAITSFVLLVFARPSDTTADSRSAQDFALEGP